MSIPAGIPKGQVTHCNYTTKNPVTYDRVNYVSSLPVSDQTPLTVSGVVPENQRIVLTSGPRSYFEHTRNTTTDELLILT